MIIIIIYEILNPKKKFKSVKRIQYKTERIIQTKVSSASCEFLPQIHPIAQNNKDKK